MLSTCYLYASCMLHIDYLYAISMQSIFHSIFLRAVIHLYFPMIGHVHIIHFSLYMLQYIVVFQQPSILYYLVKGA